MTEQQYAAYITKEYFRVAHPEANWTSFAITIGLSFIAGILVGMVLL